MEKIKLHPQKVSDAKSFFEILNNKNFKYFAVCPKSIAEEVKFLKKSKESRRKNIAHNYSIIFNGKLVGGCGIKINQHRKYIAEIGYFVDEKYWGKGIATSAVRAAEDICFKKLKIKRIEILMNPRNRASEKVAVKNGYKKEGLMKSAIKQRGKYSDAFLYAKIKK